MTKEVIGTLRLNPSYTGIWSRGAPFAHPLVINGLLKQNNTFLPLLAASVPPLKKVCKSTVFLFI